MMYGVSFRPFFCSDILHVVLSLTLHLRCNITLRSFESALLTNFKMNNVKTTPPGITTTVANQAQSHMGDRPTSTTKTPNMRPDEKQLTLQWFGNKGTSSPA